MLLYHGLSRLFPRSFAAKILVVVFAGIHLPFLSLLLWLHQGYVAQEAGYRVLLVVLAATSVSTGLTLLALYRLLRPLRQAADALDDYYNDQRLPRLPDLGSDEIGRLLQGINRNLHGVEAGLRDLRRNVLLDPLTEALNRRGCEQAMAESAQRVQRGAASFVLFVVDLDNLKPINDQLGHLMGDQVLVTLVSSAGGYLKGPDWIGRWGGDEFLLGLHASREEARARVSRWLMRMESPGEGGPMPVYASAGCAVYRPGEDLRDLYRRADSAMYRAKFAGGARLLGELDPPPAPD